MKTPLLQSRRFWMALLDAVGAVVTTIVALQFDAETQKTILVIYAAFQPVIITVIVAYTVDNVAAANRDARIAEAQAWAKAKVEEDCCECK